MAGYTWDAVGQWKRLREVAGWCGRCRGYTRYTSDLVPASQTPPVLPRVYPSPARPPSRNTYVLQPTRTTHTHLQQRVQVAAAGADAKRVEVVVLELLGAPGAPAQWRVHWRRGEGK